MEYREIILYDRNIAIAKLTEEPDGKYSFTIDEEGLKAAADQGCPVEMLGPECIRNRPMDTIPPIFSEFEVSNEQLLKELEIRKGDSDFDILYKRAVHSDEFSKRGFWIGV